MGLVIATKAAMPASIMISLAPLILLWSHTSPLWLHYIHNSLRLHFDVEFFAKLLGHPLSRRWFNLKSTRHDWFCSVTIVNRQASHCFLDRFCSFWILSDTLHSSDISVNNLFWCSRWKSDQF